MYCLPTTLDLQFIIEAPPTSAYCKKNEMIFDLDFLKYESGLFIWKFNIDFSHLLNMLPSVTFIILSLSGGLRITICPSWPLCMLTWQTQNVYQQQRASHYTGGGGWGGKWRRGMVRFVNQRAVLRSSPHDDHLLEVMRAVVGLRVDAARNSVSSHVWPLHAKY